MYGLMTPHEATNHDYSPQSKTFTNLYTHSLHKITASSSASTPLLSTSLHHTWLHNLLSWAINNSAYLITSFHMWFLCRIYKSSPYEDTKHHLLENEQKHPSDSPWQLWHLHKAEHIHVRCRLQSKLQINHVLHSGSIVPHYLWQRGINNSGKKSGASTSQVERLVLLSGLLHGWVIAVSSPQQRKSTAHAKGSGRAASPSYILQSMPLLAALSHLHLISIAVEWCAGATQ